MCVRSSQRCFIESFLRRTCVVYCFWREANFSFFFFYRLLTFNLELILCTVRSRTPNSELAKVLYRPIRALTFPEESALGLFLALAVPLEDPYKSISLANFFEGSYSLPTNVSEEYFWGEGRQTRERRSLDRSTVYQVLENKFISYGYQGHECLLRAICETSEHSLRHNGLIGDILHVIFTPTSSRHEELPQDILQAEVVGRNRGCSKYQPQCPVGLFDLIGVLG
ncbi:uncharacterized protein LOC128886171 [Hylaeus anthracinus]|uniref:uncharacterized protein LOC128886171 n=1 Tax=Hylaeus anthracinus TaxID=313031 RepID=UPI0023B91427|nr:uncharacterized protein LOC128886171 [Hylaeus anthracinus]